MTTVMNRLFVLLSLSLGLVTGQSPSEGCESDGFHMQVGNSFKPSACQYCTCQTSGDVTCITLECTYPRCEKYETPPGGCCPVCVDDGPLIII